MELLPSQSGALEHIRQYALGRKENALKTISHILKMTDISPASYNYALGQLRQYGRIALHFHPDRLDSKLKSVAQNLLKQGIYKSQFETLISNGSVSAHPGGERDLWERKIFAGAYNQDGATEAHRPKYGAF